MTYPVWHPPSLFHNEIIRNIDNVYRFLHGGRAAGKTLYDKLWEGPVVRSEEDGTFHHRLELATMVLSP